MASGSGTFTNRQRHSRQGGPTILTAVAILCALVVALPILSVLANLFASPSPVWTHLASTVLPSYIVNTVVLGVLVGIGTVFGGTVTAWLVTMCRFPGRPLLEVGLVLPLAMPTYVIAYAYTDLLQYAGPVESLLRAVTGWEHGDYWFPEIRSLGGAAMLFTFVLYPYVYLLARASFLEQSACALEVSRSLGQGPLGTFFRVALPLARPAIVAGASLALMETLADYGAVAYFALPTFTAGIYRAWISMGDVAAAGQLASALFALIALTLLLERLNRGRRRFFHTTQRLRELGGTELRGAAALLAIGVCALPILIGFVVPTITLLHLWLDTGRALLTPRFLAALSSTVLLAGAAALIAVALALFLALARRYDRRPLIAGAVDFAALGYAIPGSVIAIGVLVPITAFDRSLSASLTALLGVETRVILTGSILVLLFAYVVRFLAVALQSVQSGLTRVTPHMEDAARSLARGPLDAFRRGALPVIAPSLFTAGLIVLVDVMKELPATLLLRPFNLETLAVQAYAFAADERLAEAGLPALAIVAIGLLPVAFLMREIAQSRAGTQRGAGVRVVRE
ncbi:MAG: iron ABC transporter permease [Alphaproteobacteria bacterium]|nr:iron ABC transporter permease [Alphaproteobacteria bacterium]